MMLRGVSKVVVGTQFTADEALGPLLRSTFNPSPQADALHASKNRLPETEVAAHYKAGGRSDS